LRVKILPSFLFEKKAKVREVDKENFEDNIFDEKIDQTYDNLLKCKSHLIKKQILLILQFERIENLI